MYKKTNDIIISNRNQTENKNNSLSGQPTARTSHHNCLGVFIDDKMKFDKHISKLCSKVSQLIEVMRFISNPVLVNVWRNLYYTLIYSTLSYAIIAWGSAFSTTTGRLVSLVSWAIILITDHSNTNSLQTSRNFISFTVIYYYFVLRKMFRSIGERKYKLFTKKFMNN